MNIMLCDIAADIVKNACDAGADTVEFDVTEIGNEFRFVVKDNGKGMSKNEAQDALGPLNSPQRKGEGTGLPFLIETVNDSAGGWDLHTEKGAGTTVAVWFDTTNPETPLIGDVSTLFISVLGLPGPKEFIIRRLRKINGGNVRYELRKSELAQALDGLSDANSWILLGTYLRSLEMPSSMHQESYAAF